MANAERDQNSVPVLLATSSADGITPVVVYADPTTHRLLVQTVASSGVGAPATTPTAIGQVYINTATNQVYISTNTTNSGGWQLLDSTGGGVSGTSLTLAIVSKTTTYTATTSDFTILCDATSGSFTVNLPAAASSTGLVYNVKKIDSSANTVTIDPNASETIDGATTKVISSQYTSVQFQCNGTSWFIL